ncbi:uncharacterized protein BDV14DRAFT_196111 [Aspergillus stella-maris]|uniref:uncharacterized protein n=1 Tax=Aspergillus stella-maris TaxID=1810926 RepID=UPI003CCD72BC
MARNVLRLWDCTVTDRIKAAAIDLGSCERYMQHYYTAHVSSSAHHNYPKDPLDDEAWEAAQTQELQSLRDKVNDQALLARALRLNDGLSCELDASDPLVKGLMGEMHVHLRIIFSNGKT